MFLAYYTISQSSCIVVCEVLVSCTHLRVSLVVEVLFARMLYKDVVQRYWKDKNRGTQARVEVWDSHHKIEHLAVIVTSLPSIFTFCFLVPLDFIKLVLSMSTFSGMENVLK
jgi:hypothetical protein